VMTSPNMLVTGQAVSAPTRDLMAALSAILNVSLVAERSLSTLKEGYVAIRSAGRLPP